MLAPWTPSRLQHGWAPQATLLSCCRLHPLTRMVEVLLYNLARIHNLWPIFLTHVCEVLGDVRPAVRAAATEALGKAVGGALAHVTRR